MFESMGIFVDMPWLVAIPAALFFGLYAWSRARIALVASVAWGLYLPYEWSMKLRILCSGECDIRIDLLAFYPFLAVLSLIALGSCGWAVWRRRRVAAGT
jgi:hypothetical protein